MSSSDAINNVHIASEDILSSPEAIKAALPLTQKAEEHVKAARKTVEQILCRKDPRLIVITGPCSIHHLKSAKEYAQRLKKLHEELSDKLYIIMRVYFEKPRTTVGWKGLLNDPFLDDSFDVEAGIRQGRELLLWLAELGLPAATEALDPITPQYLSDLFAWSAIGARTTESQTHREMASGLSMPVGFKNGTDGNIDVAINALKSSASPHRFLGINQQGQVTLIKTSGNPHGHVILRGGKKPNYQAEHIAEFEQKLSQAGIQPTFIVDCSHGNSSKDYRRQPEVFKAIIEQIRTGNKSIVGVMLESHLNAGNQAISANLDDLAYGVSITDGCIDWETTQTLLEEAAALLH